MPYPSAVKCETPDAYVSLREAVNKLLQTPTIFCRCKKSGCCTKQCKCKVANILCSSRCHKGNNKNCNNIISSLQKKTPEKNAIQSIVCADKLDVKRVPLPYFGGRINFGDAEKMEVLRFVNTCPIDIWLAILKIVDSADSSLLPMQRRSLPRLMQFVRSENYDAAKLQVAIDSEISKDDQGVIDFYGGEFQRILTLYVFPENRIDSFCDSKHCTNQSMGRKLVWCPSLDYKIGLNELVTPLAFQDSVTTWFKLPPPSICGNNMPEGSHAGFFIDVNAAPSKFFITTLIPLYYPEYSMPEYSYGGEA